MKLTTPSTLPFAGWPVAESVDPFTCSLPTMNPLLTALPFIICSMNVRMPPLSHASAISGLEPMRSAMSAYASSGETTFSGFVTKR